MNGLLNNNPTAAASAIAAAANSGNTAAITSAISFAGLAVSGTMIQLPSRAVPVVQAQVRLEMSKALDLEGKSFRESDPLTNVDNPKSAYRAFLVPI